MLSFDQYIASLPRKISSAGALIRNGAGEILIVKPSYRNDGWLLPGGSVEDRETPTQAVRREAREELGIDLRIGAPLCIEYLDDESGYPPAVDFLFDGGVISAEEIARIALPEDELSAYAFKPLEEALELICEHLNARTAFAYKALGSGKPIYIENGDALSK